MKRNYYNVQVDEARNITFPEFCVVCGRLNNGQQGIIEMTKAQSFFPSSFISALEQLSSKKRLIEIPSHKNCIRAVRSSFWKRNLLYVVIVLFWLTMGRINNWNIFHEIILIIISSAPLMYWDTKHPLPVEYILKDKKLIFTFIDKNYAERFALLNDSKIEEKR